MATRTNDWEQASAADGSTYWFSPGLSKYSWAVPEELKTDADRSREAGEWVWMEHPKEGYVPAKRSPGKGYQSMAGETLYLKKDMAKPAKLNWLNLTMSENDLVMLENVNPAVILFHIKQRYLTNQIYSYVGPILISCNPYKLLPLYTPSILNNYIKRDNRYLEPHVYAVANRAFRDLVSHSCSQSIVISGESGAGKTECTKQALQFLAEVAESAENIEQMILMANPVLEAFGNAKTIRNNNSSRFGKYLEVFFSHRNSIAGATTTNYLLEKSRVCFQAPKERNYHVFYQLVEGSTPEMKQRFRLGPVSSYNYLNQSGCDKVAGVPDDRLFKEELLPSMRELNFSQDEINSIFRIVSGILMLGNVTFENTGERKCQVKDAKSCSDAASLLEVSGKALNEVVTTTKLKVIGQAPITVNLSATEATSARDALAKFVYEKLFDWLVQKVNQVVAPKGGSKYSIGILDIFGFEIFDQNSYEQLCINFTNEKLQQFFNFHTFKQEEKCYKEEDITFEKVPYIDNQPVLDLIEQKPHGILPMVDEELIVPKGTDLTFINKLHDRYAQNPHYRAERKKRVEIFTVVHYAGDVTYDSKGFLEKDRDRLNDEAYGLLSKSTCLFLSKLFPQNDKARTRQAKKSTLGYRFTRQLTALMKTLHNTEPHYIRCIKPNPNKSPLEFYGKMSFDQLRNSGVFEAVKIRKAGYPFRYTHKEFFWRFAATMPEHRQKFSPTDMIDNCRVLISNFGFDTKTKQEIQVGRSKILYRAPQHRIMENKRNIAVERLVRVVQRVGRGYMARKLYRRMKAIVPVLEKAIKIRKVEPLQAALAQADGVGYEMKIIKDARYMLHVFEEEERVEKVLSSLIDEDPEETFGTFAEALATAKEIKYNSPTVERARKVFAEARKVRDAIDAEGEKALVSLEVNELRKVLEQANALKFPHRSPTINKIIDLIYKTSTDNFVKLQLKASLRKGDTDRIIATTIKLREISLERTKTLFDFNKFALLIDRNVWAGKKLLCFDRKSLAESMRRYTQSSIHHSLTRMKEKKDKQHAKILFKNILGYMGNPRYQAGQEVILARELLQAAVDSEEQRTEIYCQLMKQLTKNPDKTSMAKGWDLVMLCVSTFPPPSVIENHLEVFIRKNSPKKMMKRIILAMHHKMYDSKQSSLSVPDVNKMNDIVNGNIRNRSICSGYNTSIQQLDELKKLGEKKVSNAVELGANGTPRRPNPLSAPATRPKADAKVGMKRGSQMLNPEAVMAATEKKSQYLTKPEGHASKAPKTGGPSLPPNWRTAVDPESGDTYYYNAVTKATTWDMPTA
uniref:Myosin motor domain-containing protein n=2 Tax=Lotharella globosa TaxID=91324 RepID=A0A6V3LQ19_9EUKA|mmetsp:Transcript_12063/g.24244  ORF Transcript_12063/g.24244 Transcript_12063/m.24244 type:complete len:1306 (+) Transcript_12063:152-4069(+)|eukprot:CAMPEP_0167813080 /NCGR_PEP_ID=MMETSP0112_2-20121227/1636_1 /TAXON_ID=91324 /ORGANISM="Lotharella globosa, Strain CCCM811" /LENGTH=1305 /DNA_ID=CAMNT_0007712085 /DNA_START=135 /DNA_END=4052 /DNA_ORIENTATION=+